MDDKKRPRRVSKERWAILKELALEKRKNPTPAEKVLWDVIRNRQVSNLKFRRQYVIERYIVDFYCAELQLVIEVDGAIHNYHQEEDAFRQERLELHGTTILRFKNEQVTNEINDVIDKIKAVAEKLRTQNSPSPSSGEGVGG